MAAEPVLVPLTCGPVGTGGAPPMGGASPADGDAGGVEENVAFALLPDFMVFLPLVDFFVLEDGSVV